MAEDADFKEVFQCGFGFGVEEEGPAAFVEAYAVGFEGLQGFVEPALTDLPEDFRMAEQGVDLFEVEVAGVQAVQDLGDMQAGGGGPELFAVGEH